MKTLNLKQGSPDWLAARLQHCTASECAAMLGMSSYMSRTELLTMKKTGITESVSEHTQRRFDAGHAAEAAARPVVEGMIGDELFPVTGSATIDGLPLMASFDGITMLEDVVFEHKIYNAGLFESVESGVIPEQYRPQLEQQLMVSGANKALFVCSDGTNDQMATAWYKSDAGLRSSIIAGWKQFVYDLDAFVPPVVDVKIETKEIAALPPLSVSILGSVSSSNLVAYKATALDFVRSIKTDLITDEDFANAEVIVKFCDKAEKELENVKKEALSSTADISLLFKTIDQLKAEMREKRLTLNKAVKSQKEIRKDEIVSKAYAEFNDFVVTINSGFKGVCIPPIPCDFNAAIRGKRTLSSMRDSVSVELARAKIDATGAADAVSSNLSYIRVAAPGLSALFPDLQNIIAFPLAEFKSLITARLETHRLAEQKRMDAERERIRAEEQCKAEAAEREKAAAIEADLAAERDAERAIEIERVRADERAKAQAEIAAEREKQKAIDEAIPALAPEPSPAAVQLVEEVAAAIHNGSDETVEMVTIPLAEYNALLQESLFLAALTKEGVGKLKCFERASASILGVASSALADAA